VDAHIVLSKPRHKPLLALLVRPKGTDALLVRVKLVGARILAHSKLDGRVVSVHAPAYNALGVD